VNSPSRPASDIRPGQLVRPVGDDLSYAFFRVRRVKRDGWALCRCVARADGTRPGRRGPLYEFHSSALKAVAETLIPPPGPQSDASLPTRLMPLPPPPIRESSQTVGPVSRPAASPQITPEAQPWRANARSKTTLVPEVWVLEDEDIGPLIVRMLEKCGYRGRAFDRDKPYRFVEEFAAMAEAPVVLALPSIPAIGMGLASTCRGLAPTMKILLIPGGGPSSLESWKAACKGNCDAVLPKPFRSSELTPVIAHLFREAGLEPPPARP